MEDMLHSLYLMSITTQGSKCMTLNLNANIASCITIRTSSKAYNGRPMTSTFLHPLLILSLNCSKCQRPKQNNPLAKWFPGFEPKSCILHIATKRKSLMITLFEAKIVAMTGNSKLQPLAGMDACESLTALSKPKLFKKSIQLTSVIAAKTSSRMSFASKNSKSNSL